MDILQGRLRKQHTERGTERQRRIHAGHTPQEILLLSVIDQLQARGTAACADRHARGVCEARGRAPSPLSKAFYFIVLVVDADARSDGEDPEDKVIAGVEPRAILVSICVTECSSGYRDQRSGIGGWEIADTIEGERDLPIHGVLFVRIPCYDVDE